MVRALTHILGTNPLMQAQDLAKKTVSDIQKILEDRSKEAEELLKK